MTRKRVSSAVHEDNEESKNLAIEWVPWIRRQCVDWGVCVLERGKPTTWVVERGWSQCFHGFLSWSGVIGSLECSCEEVVQLHIVEEGTTIGGILNGIPMELIVWLTRI